MSYDLFAQHPISSRPDAQELPDSWDPYARVMLFAQALRLSAKDEIREHEYKNELGKLEKSISSSLLANLNLDTPKQIDLSFLPDGSFCISFEFRLARPYISRDDEPFYIIDNPLVKEKVFKRPLVRPSGWKGALRAAIRLAQSWDDNHCVLNRLFGTASGNNDQRQGGRLYFYPTFFNKIDLEIINPHDRETKAGTNPIWFECVPIEAKGTFTLLYVPFDLVGEGEQQIGHQVAEDLQLIAAGIRAMMTTYGFGAKTSSGFGLAKDSLSDGCLCVAGPIIPEIEPSEQQRLPHSPTAMRSFASWDELIARAAELSR